MCIEAVRLAYRPGNVNALFVGESAPAAGGVFYLGDSLTKYTKEAFSNVYDVNFNSDQGFLARFKENNFYLDDLCLVPVNSMDQANRNMARRNSVAELSNRLIDYNPRVIICIMRAITDEVRRAIAITGINNYIFHSVSFPAHGNQRRYVEELTTVLNELKERNTIGQTFM